MVRISPTKYGLAGVPRQWVIARPTHSSVSNIHISRHPLLQTSPFNLENVPLLLENNIGNVKIKNNVISWADGRVVKALCLGSSIRPPQSFYGVGSNPTLLKVFLGFDLVVGGRGGVFG